MVPRQIWKTPLSHGATKDAGVGTGRTAVSDTHIRGWSTSNICVPFFWAGGKVSWREKHADLAQFPHLCTASLPVRAQKKSPRAGVPGWEGLEIITVGGPALRVAPRTINRVFAASTKAKRVRSFSAVGWSGTALASSSRRFRIRILPTALRMQQERWRSP